MARVVVVGSGIAGTAAALAARSAGAEVVLVRGRPGATSLGSGALDGDAAPSAAAGTILEALGGYVLGDAVLASTSGMLRRARGRDRALLALPEGGTVLVPQCDHPRWHAPTYARAWNASPLAHQRKLHFTAVKVSMLRTTEERSMGDVELAMRFDDDARVAYAAERLREALPSTGTVKAIALPPWLGAQRARAEALSARVGVPCGEVLGDPAGPAGERFEASRDRALEAAGVEVVAAWVTRIERQGRALLVHADGAAPLRGDTVVLATGGILAGGVVYSPSEAILSTAMPPNPRPIFTLPIDVDVRLGLDGKPLGMPGSMFGIAPEALAWPFSDEPALERVGILTDHDGRASPAIFVAGDIVEGRRRTWLEALESGAHAGTLAAEG